MIKNINIKNILKFTWPSIFTMLFMSIYTMVDGIFVANLVNEQALSAVNITYPVISVVIALALMIGVGGNAICAKLLGEGHKKKANQYFTLYILTGIVIGIISVIVINLNLDGFLSVLGSDSTTLSYSRDYLGYLNWFLPFLIIQIIVQNAYITANKPGMAFITMLIGGVTNVVLDYLFMSVFGMGITGAAVATGIGYTIPAIIGIIYFFKPNKDLHFTKPKFDIKAIRNASLNGSSEMVANIATAVTTFLFNVTLLNLVGSNGVAAITVIIYAQMFLSAIFMGYSMGIGPVISYNYGSKNKNSLYNLFWSSIKIILVFSAISTVLAVVLADPIALIFTDSSSEVYDLTISGLKLFSISFLFSGFNMFSSSLFTAYENGLISAVISFLRTFVFIALSILLLPNLIGINGVWLAVPIAEFLTVFISVYFIFRYKEKYSFVKNNNDIKQKNIRSKIIAVNREFGSGGREFAKRLADKLGYSYYDEEIINIIAKEYNLDKDYISKHSELKKISAHPLTFAKSFNNIHAKIGNDIQNLQFEIIKKLANEGNAIFVGRCSDFILEEYEPFKIFIYATDLDYKIDRCYEKVPSDKNKTRNEISKFIKDVDTQREKYYLHYTGYDRNEIKNYNLCIDTSVINIKDAVEIVETIYNKGK